MSSPNSRQPHKSLCTVVSGDQAAADPPPELDQLRAEVAALRVVVGDLVTFVHERVKALQEIMLADHLTISAHCAGELIDDEAVSKSHQLLDVEYDDDAKRFARLIMAHAASLGHCGCGETDVEQNNQEVEK